MPDETQYFWLNQRLDTHYSDEIGEVYSYTSKVPGHKKLSEGDKFVYYVPGEKVFLGAGVVNEIHQQKGETARETYHAHLTDYREFEERLDARELTNEIATLRRAEGLRGVPQCSIYEIHSEEFETILRHAKLPQTTKNGLPEGWTRIDEGDYYKLIGGAEWQTIAGVAETTSVVLVTDATASVVKGPCARRTYETDNPDELAHRLVETLNTYYEENEPLDKYSPPELRERLDDTGNKPIRTEAP